MSKKTDWKKMFPLQVNAVFEETVRSLITKGYYRDIDTVLLKYKGKVMAWAEFDDDNSETVALVYESSSDDWVDFTCDLVIKKVRRPKLCEKVFGRKISKGDQVASVVIDGCRGTKLWA